MKQFTRVFWRAFAVGVVVPVRIAALEAQTGIAEWNNLKELKLGRTAEVGIGIGIAAHRCTPRKIVCAGNKGKAIATPATRLVGFGAAIPTRNSQEIYRAPQDSDERCAFDGRRIRRNFTGDAICRSAFRDHELESIHVEVNDGSRVQCEDLTHHQSADDADS
jgi:hypothetical protein